MWRRRFWQARRWWSVAVVAFVTTGCAVGPNYTRPVATVPPQWAGLPSQPAGAAPGSPGATGASVPTGGPASVEAWWTVFHDPELDRLVDQADRQNLTLQQARARILQARGSLTAAGGALWPSANASASTSTSGSPSGSSAGAGSAGGNTRNQFQAGLDAAWELDFFGGARRGVEAARANLQAAVEDSRDVQVTLMAEVAFDYVQLRGFQQQITIAQKNLQSQREAADIAHKRFTVGFASALDAATADAQVATTLAEIPTLEASARQAIYALSALLGRQPAALLSELTPAGEIPQAPPAVPVGLPSELLQRRPDIRRADAELHSATAEVGVAKADLFPKFSLTGSGGLERLTQGAFATVAGGLWSVALGVTMPILDAGRLRGNLKAQEAVREQALLSYQQTVLVALQDVESSLIAYAKEQERRTALAQAVDANRTAVDLAMKRYTSGEGEFLDVLTAQRNLYATEDALVQSNRTMTTDLVALYKGLGGGWTVGRDATN